MFKRLFPTEGGALRRWIQMRKEMFEHALIHQKNQASIESMSQNALTSYMRPLVVFNFCRINDRADARSADIGTNKGGWRISDDEVIGGFSRGTLELWKYGSESGRGLGVVGGPVKVEELKAEQEKDDRTEENSEMSMVENQNDDNTTAIDDDDGEQHFIRWSGNIDTRIGPKSRAKRSGFCAIRCPEFPFGGIPVGTKYNALEFNLRSDGRAYTLNLKTDSYFEDDLYQCMITVSPDDVREAQERLKQSQSRQEGRIESTTVSTDDDDEDVGKSLEDGFVSIVLPFKDFMLTSHGRLKHIQRNLDSVQLQHLGLTLMDQKNGPFQIDISRIRLVNYRDGQIMNDAVDDDDVIVDGDQQKVDAEVDRIENEVVSQGKHP
mmetsp:Transcript_12096/g.18298  ORF Transcript_12096/g.18298 Transcript_12096/m.18298 type:complete len:379 (+) Transcript_12096:29-1165(+)